jgi:hypothetical protein
MLYGRFNLKNLNEAEGKEQYLDEVSNRLADLDAKVYITGPWETSRISKFQPKSLG